MPLRLRVGAEQPEAPVRERRAGAPGLLPVEHPAPAFLVAPGGGLERGQVGAGLGLGPALRPHLLAGRHRRQEPVLLLGRAVVEDDRREQEDAVLGDPAGSAGAVVLLLEDHPLDQRRIAAVVLLGPRHDRPARGGELRLPLLVGGPALGGVHRRQPLGRHVRGQPLPGLGPEGQLGLGQGQIHLLPQLRLQDLAGQVAGECVGELHQPRHLEVGQPFAGERDQVILR